MAQHHSTREAWLNDVAQRMRPAFTTVGAPLPKTVRVTMSLTKNRKHVGVCYAPTCSADGHTEILIRLDRHQPEEVAAILVHELVHAAVGTACGHKGRFATVAKALGLEGKMTSTTAGPELKKRLAPVLASVGPFPHAPLDWNGARSGPKKQGTRLLKCECDICGYLCRVTSKWIDSAGAPVCPTCMRNMTLEGEEGGDDE